MRSLYTSLLFLFLASFIFNGKRVKELELFPGSLRAGYKLFINEILVRLNKVNIEGNIWISVIFCCYRISETG
ncbi:hypothetical protein SAMN05216356_11854 [Oribacterium sp. WCC10]|nr:hypothetical protein SAMN05216356_11854 [Oribacterium sp. WCC10]